MILQVTVRRIKKLKASKSQTLQKETIKVKTGQNLQHQQPTSCTSWLETFRPVKLNYPTDQPINNNNSDQRPVFNAENEDIGGINTNKSTDLQQGTDKKSNEELNDKYDFLTFFTSNLQTSFDSDMNKCILLGTFHSNISKWPMSFKNFCAPVQF